MLGIRNEMVDQMAVMEFTLQWGKRKLKKKKSLKKLLLNTVRGEG